MASGNVVQITVLCLVFGAGAVISVSIVWMEYRRRTRALDVLRAYAERGEEPPASVIEALTIVSGRTHPRRSHRRRVRIIWRTPRPTRCSSPGWPGWRGGARRHSARRDRRSSFLFSLHCSSPPVPRHGWWAPITRPAVDPCSNVER